MGLRQKHRLWARMGMPVKQRLELLKQMATSLVKHERIQVPYRKAKALQRVSERVIRWGKRDTPMAQKKLGRWILEEEMMWKVTDILGPRYKYRNGGFTRVVKTKRRLGDKTKMAYIEYIDREGELRPASPVDESTHAGEQALWEDTKRMYEEFQKKQEAKLENWKVLTVKNPYLFDSQGEKLK